MTDGPEVELAGGTVSLVARVGDTVRRRRDRWSPAVHGLLRHLEDVDFPGSPRFLGIDESGREILSWIEGTPATHPWPSALLGDSGLAALAGLLRNYHDAVADYVPEPDAEWWIGRRPLATGEIVLHGDLGPWNTIWRDGQPVGLIDWDFAEPGPPLLDLAELVYFAVPLADDGRCRQCGFHAIPDRARRLRVACDAYGTSELAKVLDLVEVFWLQDIGRIERFGPQGITPWASFLNRQLHVEGRELLGWLREHRRALLEHF